MTILTPICQAVAALHAAGGMHGDISPGNIMLASDGRPLLLDLGAAQIEDFERGQAACDKRFGNGQCMFDVLDHQNRDHRGETHHLFDAFREAHEQCSLIKAAAAPNRPGCG